MDIRKGDKVKVLSGKDRGKTGKVLQVFPKEGRISVEGINILIKHLRPRRRGETGQRIEFPSPMSASNLMLVCQQCGRPSRIGHMTTDDGGKKKFRVCKKCSEKML